MDASTEELARQAIEMNMLAEVSGARIREEMLDIIDEDSPSAVFDRLEGLGVLPLLLPDGADPTLSLGALNSTERGYKVLSRRFNRAPRRRVTLVASLAADADRVETDKWLNHLRFGREYSDPATTVAERCPLVRRRLADGRKMKDSRLYRTLEGIGDEAIIFMWSTGAERVRGRIERYLDVLARIKPAVSGDDLIAEGIAPGPEYSAILSQALDDRLDEKAVGREAELANLKRIVRRTLNS